MLWSLIAAQWTLDGLYNKKIDKAAVGYYLGAQGNDDERDARAQEMIDDMTDFYKLTLESRFQKQYPSSLSDMMTFVLGQQHELKAYQNYRDALLGVNDAQLPSIGSYGSWQASPNGSSLVVADNGVYGYGSVFGKPLYFVAPPINGNLLKGTAENGSFAGIVSAPTDGSDTPAQLLYINYGTKAAPVWHAWDPQGLVDCVLSGDPLLQCGYQRVRYYIRDYATDGDADTTQRLQQMPTAAKVARDRATEAEEVAFGLIRIDMSNVGTSSDFSTKSQENSKQFF